MSAGASRDSLPGWHAGAVEIPGRSQRASVWVLTFWIGLAALLMTGCAAAAPTKIGRAGVDELVIPTPAPTVDDFVDVIDNPFLPLEPGREWVFETVGADDGETTTVTVTDQTRRVQGVRTTVVRDVVRNEAGEVVEDTYEWFAQDLDGNVWFFGTDTSAYDLDAGTTSKDGSWEAGVGGAQAGLMMAAIPRVGDGYRLGYQPTVAETRATVLALDGETSVPQGDFDELVVIGESTQLEPGVIRKKYYAKGVGLVLEEGNEITDTGTNQRFRTELVTSATRTAG